MRSGRRLAIDVGKARIGLAISDTDGILASPRDAIQRRSDDESHFLEILNLLREENIFEIYVGYPFSLSGNKTESTLDAERFATDLQAQTEIAVRMVDERLTTVSAAARLREGGKNAKQSKGLIDSASAVEILEAALSFEKSQGRSPGRAIGNYGSKN